MDISEAVGAKVASKMRSTLVQALDISDGDSGSEEEAIPVHNKRGMKLDKLHTVITSIFRKVVWLHKVIYTSTGRPDLST